MVVGAEDHVALQKKRIGGDSLGVLVKKAKFQHITFSCLLNKLIKKVKQCCPIAVAETPNFTDSTIVLGWLSSQSS